MSLCGGVVAGQAAADRKPGLVLAQGDVIEGAAGALLVTQGIDGVFHYSIAGMGDCARALGEDAGPVGGLLAGLGGGQGDGGGLGAGEGELAVVNQAAAGVEFQVHAGGDGEVVAGGYLNGAMLYSPNGSVHGLRVTH